jgi:hypothetical protein
VATLEVTGRADLTDAQWAGAGAAAGGLKRDRAVATRYDKLAVRYEATVHTRRSTSGSPATHKNTL